MDLQRLHLVLLDAGKIVNTGTLAAVGYQQMSP